MQAPRLTIDTLLQIERVGELSLSPDGAQAVVAVTRPSLDDNTTPSVLLLLSTLGGTVRPLTQCGTKDAQPRWSPRGDQIAFLARREQQGRRDEEAQLYLIAPDGGEARRAATVVTGVEAFRWFPDGQRIAFVSWVWPDLKGAKAQAERMKAWKARKETGYATSEALYRHWDHMLPMGRVPHLHVLHLATGRVRDLFERTDFELGRADPDACTFDISPDGRHVVFAHDPAAHKHMDHCHALAEITLKTGQVSALVQDPAWHCQAPRYSPDGDRIAFLAAHQGLKHTMPSQLAIWERNGGLPPGRPKLIRRRSSPVALREAAAASIATPADTLGRWALESAEWDHEVQAPLHWEDDGQALLFTAEQKGRQHLWRFDLPDRRAEVVVAGGWVQHFDKAAGTLVTVADALMHPARVHAHLPGEPPRRIERLNDAVLAGMEFGPVEEFWFKGALGDDVQMWLHYPPGFDASMTHRLLHLIHGGPHSAAGDTWSYRWNMPLFAAQDQVVAAVNYHGSSGFGYAFLDSITHRWGELELQDIEAATDALLHRPWADGRRLNAAGGSYGGYLVAWLNAHAEPGRYAALVCHAGCYDWTAMHAEDAYDWLPKELGAAYWIDMAKVHAHSPHAHAARMQTPTLVTHGGLDYRVPDQQGFAHYNTLKALGVDARLLWFPDENHWVQKPRNCRLWFLEFGAWLERHDVAA